MTKNAGVLTRPVFTCAPGPQLPWSRPFQERLYLFRIIVSGVISIILVG